MEPCRYCGQELSIVTNEGDQLVRKKERKSFVMAADGSTMCTNGNGTPTLHQPRRKEEPPVAVRETTTIALELIDPAPDNPRSSIVLDPGFVESIRSLGVQVPIAVVPRGERYEVIFGHRRYFGSNVAGKLEIPAEIRHDLENDPRGLRVARIVEQLHREDWSVIDKGHAFKQLADDGLSQRKIAELTGFSQAFVSRHLSMLDLPEPAQLWVAAGKVTQEEAVFISRLDDHWQADVIEHAAIAEDRDDELHVYLTWLQERMDRERAVEDRIAELQRDGVVVFVGDPQNPLHGPEAAAKEAKAKELHELPWVDPKKHKGEPCRAVIAYARFDERHQMLEPTVRLREFCTTPKNHPRPVRHEEGQTKSDAELLDLLEHLSAATSRRHEFLMGIEPDPVEVLSEFITEHGIDKDLDLIEMLGEEALEKEMTSVDGCVRVLWLHAQCDLEQPVFHWNPRSDSIHKPRSAALFPLKGVRAQEAQQWLDELRELGYEPSWIEELRAGLPATRPARGEPGPDDGPAITIELRKVGRKHVPICSTCGALETTSTTTEEKARTAGDDHLWGVHGLAPVTPIGANR